MDAASFIGGDESFAAVAAALRQHSEAILASWEELARREMPGVLDRLNSPDARDHLPQILTVIADALERSGPARADALEEVAPAQGHSRFRQRFHMSEALTEDRLFRRAILEHLAPTGLSPRDQVALNAAIDVAMQHGLITLYQHQREQLRSAVESELRYLSFLSHELGNSLNAVRLTLAVLGKRLAAVPGLTGEAAQVNRAQAAVSEALSGTRQLLEHERLSKADVKAEALPVRLQEFASGVVRQFSAESEAKGVRLAVEVDPHAVVRTDPTLASIVLRNFAGNAVKYSTGGTVRITSEWRPGAGAAEGRWALAVSDEGPGIPPQFRENIFEAFRRGEARAGEGVGLGLTIAAQAAKLLRADIAVESEVGKGSTFFLIFPEGAGGVGDSAPP